MIEYVLATFLKDFERISFRQSSVMQATQSSQDGSNLQAANQTQAEDKSKEPATEDGPQPMDTEEPAK